MKPATAGSLIGIITSIIWSITTVQAEIKIGIAGPLSGSSQSHGDQNEVGAQKAVAHLNATGGLLGQDIQTISVDDWCDPEQAKAAARQLVREEVVFVIGHMCSGASIAASKIYEEAGIIMISPASTNPKLTDEGGRNVFRVIGRDDQQGAVAGDFLANNYANSNIAIIHDGQIYGLGLAEHTRRRLNERGVTEVMFDSYEPEQQDYKPIVDKLIDAKVDVLYAGGTLGDIALILRLAKKHIPALQLISGDALASDDWLIYAGDAGVKAYFTFGPDIRLRPEAANIVSAFRDEDAYEPAGYTLYSYGAVQAWAQAVQQAGSLEPDAVIKVLNKGTFDTVLGQIGFDDKGDVTGMGTFVWYVFERENYIPVK